MEHRYNYFQQNPNSIVNGQSAFNRPSTDGIQSTNNYCGSIPSTSPSEQSPFHEKIHSNSNAVPLINNHLYQMDSGYQQLPPSSGPPRTNAKGIYENSESSIPNVLSLAQSNNAENYPINPDFQLQPHLTALLPQQPKRIPEIYPVSKYSTSKGSIAENMNTNYFSSNKPYPEPKIIEYDMEETSTESSPQHTSSLYSESTDPDSESTHPSNVFLRHTLNKTTECHVTKESKTITTSNQEFPVPSQFADLSLMNNNSNDDHQHSVLHSAYNQDYDDIIEDIPLFDNINQNDREHTLENQENLESRFNEQSINLSRAETFDSYATRKDFDQTKFNNENKQDSSSSLYNSITNYSPYNVDKSSNIQNASQFNKGSYFSQSNTLTQPSSSNTTIQQSQSKPLFPYGNTKMFCHQQESSSVQNSNDDFMSENCNQQNEDMQPVIQNSNVPPIDSKLQSNMYSNTEDKLVLEQSTSPAQALNVQNNSQPVNACATNLYNHQNKQGIESISQQLMYNSSKSPISEQLIDSKPVVSQGFTAHSSSLTSTQSLSPIASACIDTPLTSSFSLSKSVVQESQNISYLRSDDQASNLLHVSSAAKNSPIDLFNLDSTNVVQSELDIKHSQSSVNNILENQQESTVDQSKSINMRFHESQQDKVKSLSPPSIKNDTQSNNYFNPNKVTSQQESNNQQQSINQFIHQQPIFYDDLKNSSDTFSNTPIDNKYTINNQNMTVQQSIPTTGHSASHYFDSPNANNKFVSNQQSYNLQSSSQLQNIQMQDKPVHVQNASISLLSLNQQPLLLKNESEITESIKLETDSSSEKTLNSSEPVLNQSNDLKFESLDNAEMLIPNDQFSNMAIDKQQNISNTKILNQVQTKSTSFFSKDISLGDTFHDTSSTAPKLSEVNNKQSLPSEQINLMPLNSDLPTKHTVTPLSISNQISPDNTPFGKLEVNQFLPQQLGNKVTSNSVSSTSNQLPPKMFDNQSKLDTVQPCQTVSIPNQDTIQSAQSASNLCKTQPFENQLKATTIPSLSTQLPPQMFSNQSTSDIVSPPHFVSNLCTTQTVSATTTQLPTSMFSNKSTSNTVLPLQSTSPYPIQMFSNQSKPVTAPPIPQTDVNQFPSMFGDQPKSMAIPHNQTAVKSFNNQSTPSTTWPVSSAINTYPPQIPNSQVKSDIFPHQTMSSQFQSQPFNNKTNMTTQVPSAASQLPSQILSNQPKSNIAQIKSTTGQYPFQSFDNQYTSTTASSTANQPLPQLFSNQPKSNVVPFLQTASSQYNLQTHNNQQRQNLIPPVSSTVNQFPPQMLTTQPRLDAGLSNTLTASQYQSQPLNNQTISGAPPIQKVTNQYPPQSFSYQSIQNNFPPSQTVKNQYPSQPFTNPPGQQVLSKQNLQQSSSNQFFNQSNSVQPVQNQWPPANISSHTSPMLSQPIIKNPTPNLSTVPPSVNQQRLGTQMLPPNPLSSNNYYNQVQGNENVQQLQSSGQNVQLASRGYPPQSNTGFSSQNNYQQSNLPHGQQGFHNQQDPFRSEQNHSVVQQGFAKTWGYDNLDLLKSRDVLPSDGVQAPEIKLPQGYANCDNCSPDIFRCTLNKFPSSKSLLDKSRLPLGILIHPYKDLSRLTVIQCETITRCRNCRSYINPFVQFIDNAHWKCNLCYRVNELPGEFQIDPYTKTLGDPSRRPEIQNATIEYIASQDYMVRPPQPALYLFLLDVSRTATLTGYLEIVCDRILNKIMADDIPGDSRTNIGFITYDSSVHFYQIANSDGGQPKQLIVSDISDIFLPLPDGLMVNLEENKKAIKDLLTSLPNNYRESYNTGCALGAALQAAFKILAPRGGRVTVFQACLPNCGPGSLESRDDGNPHTGERVQHMAPSTDFYKKLALECSGEQIAVDIFFVSSQYLDVATVSGISKYSSGCIHNFPQFDVKSPTIVTRFINCFDRYLSRKIGFEALLRLRCTRGVAIHSFHGNFFVRSSDLLMLPNVNPDNAYGMQLSIEDSLEGVSVVCFQAALLYTSSNAERRIRVHTLCIPVTENLDDVFHNADQQAITCLIAKMAVDRSTEKSLSDAREAFFNAISDSLSAFKLGCSSYNGPGTMLSPVSLKVFPLYILATLKHAAFRTNQPTRLDERMFSMCQMKSLPLNNLIQYIYPDLYPLYALEEQPKIDYEKLTEIPLPPVIQLSAERVESNGVYLMDDSETLTIFIGHRCSDQLIQQLFGYVNVNSMPELITTLAEVDSKPSYLLRSFISYLQHFKPYPLPIEIIKDNGPHKLRFYSRLVEDKFESSLSYYEFLQRLSQQVR